MTRPWNAARAASKRKPHRRSVIAPVVCGFMQHMEVPAVRNSSAKGDYVACKRCGWQTCKCVTIAEPVEAKEALPPGWTDCGHKFVHVSGAFVGTECHSGYGYCHDGYGYCWAASADADIVPTAQWKPTIEEAMAAALAALKGGGA